MYEGRSADILVGLFPHCTDASIPAGRQECRRSWGFVHTPCPVRLCFLALAVVVGIAGGKVDLCAGGGSGILAPCERDRGESLALSSSVTPKATARQADARIHHSTGTP